MDGAMKVVCNIWHYVKLHEQELDGLGDWSDENANDITDITTSINQAEMDLFNTRMHHETHKV